MTTPIAPGPWSLTLAYTDTLTVVDANGFEIAQAESIAMLSEHNKRLIVSQQEQPKEDHRALSEDEQAANARLIAAAPDLLNALILMVRTHDEPADNLLQEAKEMQWLAQARAAIAKARGNT